MSLESISPEAESRHHDLSMFTFLEQDVAETERPDDDILFKMMEQISTCIHEILTVTNIRMKHISQARRGPNRKTSFTHFPRLASPRAIVRRHHLSSYFRQGGRALHRLALAMRSSSSFFLMAKELELPLAALMISSACGRRGGAP
jgi:hypothetical protein